MKTAVSHIFKNLTQFEAKLYKTSCIFVTVKSNSGVDVPRPDLSGPRPLSVQQRLPGPDDRSRGGPAQALAGRRLRILQSRRQLQANESVPLAALFLLPARPVPEAGHLGRHLQKAAQDRTLRDCHFLHRLGPVSLPQSKGRPAGKILFPE